MFGRSTQQQHLAHQPPAFTLENDQIDAAAGCRCAIIAAIPEGLALARNCIYRQYPDFAAENIIYGQAAADLGIAARLRQLPAYAGAGIEGIGIIFQQRRPGLRQLLLFSSDAGGQLGCKDQGRAGAVDLLPERARFLPALTQILQRIWNPGTFQES